MAKHTRRVARKGTRKVRHSRRHGTRRMKRGGGLFTRNSAVAPRRNAPYREGSVAYNTAKKAYNANKSKVSELVQRLDDAITKAMKDASAKYGSMENAKKKMTKEEMKQLAREKVSINKEGTKEAREAIENYLKITAKVKESKIKNFLKSHAAVLPKVKEYMEGIGIQNETIDSLFDDIDKDTLTVAKAATLVELIKKNKMIAEGTNAGNGSQSGGGDDSGAGAFVLWSAALWLAIPSAGISLLVAAFIQIIMLATAK